MSRSRGFTLIEMLVVLGLLLLLTSFLMPSLLGLKASQKVKECRAEIAWLKTVLEQYRDEFGDYPPSRMTDLVGSAAAGTPNQGNRALVTCLATTRGRTPYLRSYIANNPDKMRAVKGQTLAAEQLDWIFTDRQVRELLDPWGCPYIYLHNRDYGPDIGYVYTLDGDAVTPQKRYDLDADRNPIEATGVYHGATSFQIWSCGPNKLNDSGGKDDITSWQ